MVTAFAWTDQKGGLREALPTVWGYVRGGVRTVIASPRLFAEIVIYFSLPALAASVLAGFGPQDDPALLLLLFVLDSVTTVLAAVVFMMAVGAGFRGEAAGLGSVFQRAVSWLPRYVWTNAHTSLVFWLPVGGALLMWERLAPRLIAAGVPEWLLALVWPPLLAALATYFHSRTLLAPFLAVHSDVPSSLAAWHAWDISGRHLTLVVSTFVLGSAPLAAPVLLLLFILVTGGLGGGTHMQMVPHLVAVGIQLVRLTLIPAAYLLYRDLWALKPDDWKQSEALRAPAGVGLVMGLTGWLPPMGPMGRSPEAGATRRVIAEQAAGGLRQSEGTGYDD